MIRRAAIPALLVLAFAAPASAAPVAEQVQAGQVTATLSYEKSGDGFSDFHLQIQRAGLTLVEEDLATGCEREPCGFIPANQGAGEKSITARDLNRDGEPEVWVDLFTGGAHCCTRTIFYGFQAATGAYERLRHDWFDAGYRLRDLGGDGIVEFDSRDARFAYLFTSYAESFLPVQIWRWTGDRLRDVTKRFRGRIRKDARRAFRLYRRYRGGDVSVRGALAGYAADKYRLGQRRAANRVLRRALRRGDLVTPLQFGPKTGQGYIKKLKRILRRFGYA